MTHRKSENPFWVLISGIGFAYGYWYTQDWFTPNNDWMLVPVLFGLFAAFQAVRLCMLILRAIPQGIRYWFLFRARGEKGTAGFASKKAMKRARVFKAKGFYIGKAFNRGVFAALESTGLVLSPAGGGKTAKFVIPNLCFQSMSMLVIDLKSILAVITAAYRKKCLKHKVITVNPCHKYTSILGAPARYNPLQLLIDDWNNPDWHSYVFADARSLARQLIPEPARSGENKFWRNGSRKFLVVAFIYLVTIKEEAKLSKAYSLLCNTVELENILRTCAASTILSGDLASLAQDLLTKLEDGDPKQVESFREGAVQALEDFAPSTVFAQNTEACDFRFYDLKKEKCTIYLMGDATRAKASETWAGLLSWCAITELIRFGGGREVCMMCDEVTNFYIDGLPELLTLAREYKIIIWLIVQELAQWAYKYGNESLDTLLSQSEVKVFLGVRSHKGTQLISDMLGVMSIKTINHNLGSSFFDPISRSLSENARAVLTADEVHRFNEIILFVREHRPMIVEAVGYHEIHPWRKQVAINPLYGKKFLGKVKLWVSGKIR